MLADKQTNKQTHKHADRNNSHPYRRRSTDLRRPHQWTKQGVAVHADLHVEMYDVPGMNEGDSLADLPRKADARFLRQHEVVADGAFKQLSAVHATITQTQQSHITLDDTYYRNKSR